jgi:hypothetical protein
VLAVEPRRGLGGDDEELRPVRVRARVRHREGAALDLVLVELVLELVAGAAGAGALGAAALDHEIGDHAVEGEAVVEAVLGQLAEVRDRLRGVLVVELDRDRPGVRVQHSL